MAVTGLQRNVIAMAFWCKSDGGQHQGKLPPPKATQLSLSLVLHHGPKA
ncbi:hypothetical protein I5369_00615 [Citrobacter freundii]|nr:hypothetical protein [Citrobacter freundii]